MILNHSAEISRGFCTRLCVGDEDDESKPCGLTTMFSYGSIELGMWNILVHLFLKRELEQDEQAVRSNKDAERKFKDRFGAYVLLRLRKHSQLSYCSLNPFAATGNIKYWIVFAKYNRLMATKPKLQKLLPFTCQTVEIHLNQISVYTNRAVFFVSEQIETRKNNRTKNYVKVIYSWDLKTVRFAVHHPVSNGTLGTKTEFLQ